MQVRKQQLELDMKQQTGSKQEKESIKAVYCHPAYLTYMQSTSWEMLGWKKHKLESRLLGGISIKIMESGPITSWEIDGEMVETVSDFIFWGSKITAYGDCSHEIQRCLLLGRKVMTNLDNMLKSRDITLPTKVHLVKAMVFQVVMYRYQSWTIKKADSQKIDAFELWCWRRLLRVPWTTRSSNQSILKEISPGCSLEGLMLRLKLQCFGHLMWRTDSLEKTLMLGKIEGRRRRGWQRMRWLDSITAQWTWVWVNSGSWWWTGRPGVLQSMGLQRVEHKWATELNWTNYQKEKLRKSHVQLYKKEKNA